MPTPFSAKITKGLAFSPLINIRELVHSYLLDENLVDVRTLQEQLETLRHFESLAADSRQRITALDQIEEPDQEPGADFTLIPLNWLLQVDAPPGRWAYLRGFWSEQRQVTLYLVDLHFESLVLPGMEVVGLEEDQIEMDDEREAVLGRNVLNRIILLLGGPRQQIDILERGPSKF